MKSIGEFTKRAMLIVVLIFLAPVYGELWELLSENAEQWMKLIDRLF